MAFDDTLGAAFVGFAVACLLHGVLLTQVYVYFQRYTTDRPLYRYLVLSVLVIETFHSGLTGHTVYHYAISNFDNLPALIIPTWTLIIQVLVGATISVLVKSTFAMRVWRFSNHNVFLTGSIAILNAAIFVLAVIFTVKAFSITTFLELPKLKWWITAVLATSVATDLIIAASLTYFLHRLRNSFSANTLVDNLIKYSIETGAVTSVCGIATLIAVDLSPMTYIYMAFFFVLSKLYSNSLLATLNTRRVTRGRGTDSTLGISKDFPLVHTSGQVQTAYSTSKQNDWQNQSKDIEVNVLHEVLSVRSDIDFTLAKPIETGPAYSQKSDRIYHADLDVARFVRSPERAAWV